MKFLLFVFVTIICKCLASSSMLNFESKQGRIYLNNQLFDMKGITHFGIEGHLVVDGLYSVTLDSILNDIANQNFNVIRVAFAAASILLNTPPIPATSEINFALNPDLRGLNVLQILDIYIQKAAQRGILIMLDMHRLRLNGPIDDLWYDSTISETQMIEVWRRLFIRYKNQWNVFGADLKNEPHGIASWGNGNLATDWRLAAERISNELALIDPNMLFFIEGVELNAIGCNDPSYFWGGNLCGVRLAPIRLNNPIKIVYTPHVYGPTVSPTEPYFFASNFPNNLPAVWDRHFGFVSNETGRATIIGEWGGFYTQPKQKQWTDLFIDYLISRNIRDNVFFSVSPTSSDTDGIYLSDWRTPYTAVLGFLDRLQPNPTRIIFNSTNPTTRQPTTGIATTRQATTGIATTRQATTGIATTRQPTTRIATTRQATTGIATTRQATTGIATTRQATTGIATTRHPTTGIATTRQATTFDQNTDVTSQPASTTGIPTNNISNVRVKLRETDSWKEYGQVTKLYELKVTNIHPTKKLLFVQLESNNMNPIDKWSLKLKSVITFPQWLEGVGLNPGQTWISGFIISQNSVPELFVTMVEFV